MEPYLHLHVVQKYGENCVQLYIALYCRNGRQFENLFKDSRAMFRNVGFSVSKREWLSLDWGSGSNTVDGALRDAGHRHYQAFFTFRMACVFSILVDAAFCPHLSIDREVTGGNLFKPIGKARLPLKRFLQNRVCWNSWRFLEEV